MRKRNRQVWWSSRSRQDLEEIAAYLYRVAPRASAEKLLRALVEIGDSLNSRASLWPLRPELLAGIRSAPVRPYAIFYRVSDSEVEIVRVLHGHRNIEAVLRQAKI